MRGLSCILITGACALLGPAVAAQTTAFTYQGLLKDGDAPASGQHDFRFRLFDAATGGAAVGTVQCVDNLLVTEGTFTATVDFGNQFATPAQRFIEVEVRRDTGLACGNAAGFTTLTTRQLITAAPLAAHAKSAFSLAAANGSIANAVFVDNAGKVGVGTTAPTHTLHIAAPEPTIALQDTDSAADQVGLLSFRDSGNAERGWIGYGTVGDPDLSIVNTRFSGDIVLSTLGAGRVGIGTASPQAKLEVHGDIRLGGSGELFAPGAAENLRIVAGRITAGGGIQPIQGTGGFTVSHSTTGIYTITFNPPFGTPPSVTVTAEQILLPTTIHTAINIPNSGGTQTFSVGFTSSSGANLDSAFSFIAIGRR